MAMDLANKIIASDQADMEFAEDAKLKIEKQPGFDRITNTIVVHIRGQRSVSSSRSCQSCSCSSGIS